MSEGKLSVSDKMWVARLRSLEDGAFTLQNGHATVNDVNLAREATNVAHELTTRDAFYTVRHVHRHEIKGKETAFVWVVGIIVVALLIAFIVIEMRKGNENLTKMITDISKDMLASGTKTIRDMQVRSIGG